MKGQDKEISRALLSLAKGCKVAEVIEEYTQVDGEMRLTKRKETRRDIPPDLKAVQMLLENGNSELSSWTDEQLEEEKARILALLNQQEKKKKQKSKANKQGEEV